MKHHIINTLSGSIFRSLQASIQWSFFALIVSFLFIACTKEDDPAMYEESIDISDITSRELPKNPSELKILAIGNSFTEDAVTMLPYLLDSSHIYNIQLGMLTLGGSSLEEHLTNYQRKAPVYDFNVTKENRWKRISANYTIDDAIHFEDWDLIILQQVSRLSGQVQSYQPYLNQLIKKIDDNSTYKNTVFGWHMTWAYARSYTSNDFKYYGYNQLNMYAKIVNAVQAMQSETGIKIIIPSGTAIQNLRNTSLNDPPMDLTRDGSHISLGIGRYTLSCTWFQALIAPLLGSDLSRNKYRVLFDMQVTDDNYNICQQAVLQACRNKFEVSQ